MPLLLSQRRKKMQHKRIAPSPEFRHNERNSLHHQTRDEVHIAGDPIQLRYHNRAAAGLGASQGCQQLRPTLQSIRALAGLDFNKFRHELKALSLNKSPDGFALSLYAQPRFPLLTGAHPQIAHDLAHFSPLRLLLLHPTVARLNADFGKRNSVRPAAKHGFYCAGVHALSVFALSYLAQQLLLQRGSHMLRKKMIHSFLAHSILLELLLLHPTVARLNADFSNRLQIKSATAWLKAVGSSVPIARGRIP